MKFIKIAMFFAAGFVASFLGDIPQAHSKERVISDSLVDSLSCNRLSVDSIYRAIRDDAFHESRNLPIQNWGFRSGVANLAGCWGLASTQRMVAYLGRYYTADRDPRAQVPTILDMVRGGRLIEETEPERALTANSSYRVQKLRNYTVFQVEQGSLAYSKRVRDGLWELLERGYDQTFHRYRIVRNFRNEIEANQASHFYRIRNLGMGLGSGPRSASNNKSTLNQLLRNLDGKRLTLLNLRISQTVQHIVMAKSYRYMNKTMIEIKVYDSNAPERDHVVYYDLKGNHFFAPEIMKKIDPARGNYALGTFIVDEKERLPFERAMLAYYQQRCRQ